VIEDVFGARAIDRSIDPSFIVDRQTLQPATTNKRQQSSRSRAARSING
jgi:hypothetical protein